MDGSGNPGCTGCSGYNALHMRVLVLAAPCLRVSYLACYGCDWVRTPHLDRLAAEAVVFDQHFADTPSRLTTFLGSSDTAPNRSWWTGRYMFPCDSEMPGVEVAPQLPGLLETHGIRMVHVVSRSRMADAAGTPSL